MFLSNLLKSGWIHALFMGLIAYPLGAMRQKFVATNGDINILVYTGLCMLCASWLLLFLSGNGKLTLKSLRTPHTWIYGLLETVTISVGVFIMVYITATEAAALSRTTAIFTFVLSMFFLRQDAKRSELLGFFVMIIGFIYACFLIELPIALKASLILLIILKNFLQASKKVTIELHKTNQASLTEKDRMRVTGIVMAITSMIFMSGLFLIAGFQSFYDFKIHNYLPMLGDFLNFKMFLVAIIGGGLILSLNKYLEFFVGKALGAKYLMTMASLQIVGLYVIERLLSYTEWFEMKEFSIENFYALGIILLGNLIISLSGFIKDLTFIRKGEKQDTLANLDDNFIGNEIDFNLVKLNLANLLSLYDQDSKALAKDIEIDRIKLDNIINYEYGEIKINNKLAKKINSFASQNVSTKDKLTKAYNRYYLEHTVNKLFKSDDEFKLYYLDLNKFKPINDDHGHEVGDFVLVETVSRLNDLEAFNGKVFRIGGDEFVLIQTDDIDTDLTSLITKKIEKTISFKNLSLEISTSIGITISDEYNNLSDMLKDADDLMFENKKRKGVNR